MRQLPVGSALDYAAGSGAGTTLGALGKLADLVVLDRDPFDAPPEEIGRARVARPPGPHPA
jgi:predicted amidohydrolase YtcJ